MFVVPSGVLVETAATGLALNDGAARASTARRTGAQRDAPRRGVRPTGWGTAIPARGGGSGLAWSETERDGANTGTAAAAARGAHAKARRRLRRAVVTP